MNGLSQAVASAQGPRVYDDSMKSTANANGDVPKLKTFSRKSARGRELSLRTILVPTDFSRRSKQAIRWAKFIAQQSHGNIHLVHVHDYEYAVPAEIALEIMFQTDVEKSLRRDLSRVAAKHALPNIKTSCHIRSGRAFDQVEKLAEELRADLIVTSTHGYTGLQHLLLGSTAERIVRHSARPVFVVRVAKNGRMRAPRLKKIVVHSIFRNARRSACITRCNSRALLARNYSSFTCLVARR